MATIIYRHQASEVNQTCIIIVCKNIPQFAKSSTSNNPTVSKIIK